MALDPREIVDRLFEQLAAEYFDFTVTVSDREDADRWPVAQAGTVPSGAG